MIICSFSGGRSSAVMLHRLLQGDEEMVTIFCNTGKEHPATLDFVRDIEVNWGVPIVWLEYRDRRVDPKYAQVNYETASRNGEPFAKCIEDRNYLPNMIARFCTSELKVLTMERYLKDQGIDDYDMAVGIRGDEPRRLVKMRNKENYICPIADLAERDIREFWQSHSFDLALPPAGDNLYSNCDLCYLKGGKIKQSIIQENPEMADWWIEQENKIGGTFRGDQPTYGEMKIIARDQPDMFQDTATIGCFCGD